MNTNKDQRSIHLTNTDAQIVEIDAAELTDAVKKLSAAREVLGLMIQAPSKIFSNDLLEELQESIDVALYGLTGRRF